MGDLLKGKIALITGAASGIGEATAHQFAQQGAFVYIADINMKDAERVANEIVSEGGQAKAIYLDVSNMESVDQVIAQVLAEKGRIDIWDNNAGISKDSMIDTIEPEHWEREVYLDLKCLFFITQKVIRVMEKQNYGKIINIASLAGRRGGRGASPSYTASKAGILALTKAFADYAGKFNITVNSVAPGLIVTPLVISSNARWLYEPHDDILLKDAEGNGRIGQTIDIGKAILFYATDLSAYVTGDNIDVNGGMYYK